MYLKFIDEGTAMKIQEEAPASKEPFSCDAVFFRLESDSTFWAGGLDLYNNVYQAGEKVNLSICFYRGANMHTFTGAVKRLKMEGRAPLVLLEQVSGITSTSRREYERNEMRLDVRVYAVDPASLDTGIFRKADSKPVFHSEMFDISVGGMCLVSNERLTSDSEPYFLLEFAMSMLNDFLIPAKLVRKSNCPQTALYNYDYGFEFNLKNSPEEKNRLVMAIFNSKVISLGGR